MREAMSFCVYLCFVPAAQAEDSIRDCTHGNIVTDSRLQAQPGTRVDDERRQPSLDQFRWQYSLSPEPQQYTFRMPNIGFQNLPLNIYIVVFGTAIFVFILSLLFCCYLIRLRHQAHKELYAYKQVIQKEKVKELNLHEICAVCLEEFKQKDELGICPCKHAFHRKCLIKWLEVRKVCPLCNMPVLQLAQQQGTTEPQGPTQQPLPGMDNPV
ncbi:RING finger protein 24-like [Megalops cyprinoides]|uniref:RING finger protein 24-like n=1 Tax=Megalops cyprinoides TaxID=118141 RepID=UPI001863FD10|nr:RING finger protein 24-like [Megalops cyprinoides]